MHGPNQKITPQLLNAAMHGPNKNITSCTQGLENLLQLIRAEP